MIKYNTLCVDTNLSDYTNIYFNSNSNTELALNNGIKSLSNLNTIGGYSFDSLTYLAVNYFYDNVFVYYEKNDNEELIKHSFNGNNCKTLTLIKGYFDACNYTPYTPIHTVDTIDFRQLFNATMYTECYLIIQTAYFFGSDAFGKHEYIEVVEHYRKTGSILKSNLDKSQLKRAFETIDSFKNWDGNGKKPSPFNKYTYLNNWYFGVLDIIVNVFKSLGHNCINYNYEYPKKEGKVSEYRIYNRLIQTPRILRKIQPFEMIEFDIKSGHLSYIDLFVGSNVSKTAYDNYAQIHRITRDEAKRKFQSILNWRAFRKTPEKQKRYHADLCGFGWTPEQATRIINEVTDAPDYLFGHFASRYEMQFTNVFCEVNKITDGTRGHDAIYQLRKRGFDYSTYTDTFENGIIQFELKPTATHKPKFEIQERLYNAPNVIYFNGLHRHGIVIKEILGKLPPIVLTFTDYVEVVWRRGTEKEERFNVYVGLNYFKERYYFIAPKINTDKELIQEIKNAYDTILVLNNYNITTDITHEFCQHLRKYINFDIVALERDLTLRDGNGFNPEVRDSRISVIANNETEIINDEVLDFNTMVSLNKAEKFCSEYWDLVCVRELIILWINNEYSFLRSPRKNKLFLKMHELDKHKKTAILPRKPPRIKNTNIIQSTLASGMAVIIAQNKGVAKPKPIEIQIDTTRTKERKEKQLANQQKKHQKLMDKYTELIWLTKEVSKEIIEIFNQKLTQYDIKQK